MTYYYTYKITLLKGTYKDMYYYGQHKTNNLDDGYCGSGVKLKNYYKKYGKINGETYIKQIINFYNSLDELNIAEYNLIGDKYETDSMCLNLLAGGNNKGCSEETKAKISKANLGRKQSESEKTKRSNSHKGHILSKETKEKISKANKGRKASNETKKKLSNSHKGHIPCNKGKPMSEEQKKKISEKLKGFHLSEEQKKKISEKLKGVTKNKKTKITK